MTLPYWSKIKASIIFICGNISNISIMLQKNPPVQEKKGYFCISIMNIRAIFRFADKNIMISLIREYEVMRHQ